MGAREGRRVNESMEAGREGQMKGAGKGSCVIERMNKGA